jgi:hypothetical protein
MHCSRALAALYYETVILLYDLGNAVNRTLIERKLRVLQIQGVKGEAVVCYCEPLTTQEIGYHRLSRRVNKMKI